MKKICQLYLPQIFRSFGQNSLAAIMRALGHFASRGFTGLYLIGLWKSGGADNGFDVIDYCVDPAYSACSDFALRVLVERAHKFGLEVGVDVVPNHISDKSYLTQLCLSGTPGYEDVLYIVDQKEAERLTKAGALSLFGEEPYSQVEGFVGQDKFVRNTFCNGRQLNLNWDSCKVQEYFTEVFAKLKGMHVDFARIDCSVLLHEDISKVTTSNPLACINAKKSVEAIRQVAGDMVLYHEWFGAPFSLDIFDNDPKSFALDCSYVLSSKQPTEWDNPKLVPLLGGHDQMPFLNRSAKQRFNPDLVYQRALKNPSGILFSDIPTEMKAMIPVTEMDFVAEDEPFDADPSNKNLRYLGRRKSEEIECFLRGE